MSNPLDNLKVVMVPIGDLRLNPDNTNIHPPEQIKDLAAGIKYQGWRYPILIDDEYFIQAGEGRYLAAQKLKLKEVPVAFQKYVDEDQKRSFVTFDNAIAAWAQLNMTKINDQIKDYDPSFDIKMLGIKDFTLDVSEKFDPLCDEDDVPENVETSCQPGDLWILGGHRLLCGDSTNIQHVERLMGGEKADMVFTDPPYGINFDYNQYKDTEENWYELINSVLPLAKQFSPFVVMPCCRIVALEWWYTNHPPDWIMCWYKGSPGHRSKVGFNDWEPHLVWGKPKNQIHDYWQTRCGFKQEGDKHSCPKPIEYSQWIIERAINKGDVLLEFFGGSGSTLIACEKTNRKCYMMELDPHYCDVILERWEKYTGKTAKLFDDK